MQKWLHYVKKVTELRRFSTDVVTTWSSHVLTENFMYWKTRAARPIALALIAAKAYAERSMRSLQSIFGLFRSVCHSRRICRREIRKLFKFKPDGPFTEVDEFYTRKRALTIRAMHSDFVKRTPPYLREWHAVVLRTKQDNKATRQVHQIRRRAIFAVWTQVYRDHFHGRILIEIRRRYLDIAAANARREFEAAEKVDKVIMLQLVRDRDILGAKLSQFDRLSQNHHEAVLRRNSMRGQISGATNEFFKRQEELQLIDFWKQALDIDRKTREVRRQLADGLLYHLGRTVRAYDNQVIAHQFCLAFRILSEPVVQRAIGYFYEKRHVRTLVGCATRQKGLLETIVKCCGLWHQNTGWQWWRKFIDVTNQSRSPGLVPMIRRRTLILQLFPYFNWTETLPVKPPRPLKEIEQMFRDLPAAAVQRKIARERARHITVKALISHRRLLRDFLRAYAAFVQRQIATREVLQLMRTKQQLRLYMSVLGTFQTNAKQIAITGQPRLIPQINADITAWFKHFFKERNRTERLVRRVPVC
jgi:hypothetical protein